MLSHENILLAFSLFKEELKQPSLFEKRHICLYFGHKSSTGTVRRLFHQKAYDSTTPVRCPAGGRKNRTIFYHFLDIVRCPVKFRYYLKFHGARTAFGRFIEGKITSAGHRTVPGRRPAGVFTHRTGTGRFLFNIYIVRCLTSARKFQNRLTNRPMPVRAPDDARPGTGRCFMSQTATGEKRRVFAEEHIAFT